MPSQLEQLKNRIFSKGSGNKGTALTDLLEMVREFSCLGEMIGRDYEIKDSKGKLVYTIRQKPMAIKQMNVLLKEFTNIKRRDNERESAKWGGKKGSKRKRR